MCRLCVVWQRALGELEVDQGLPQTWGPSEMDLAVAEAGIDWDCVAVEEDEEDEMYEYQEFDDDDLDLGLIECMDALELSDNCVTYTNVDEV